MGGSVVLRTHLWRGALDAATNERIQLGPDWGFWATERGRPYPTVETDRHAASEIPQCQIHVLPDGTEVRAWHNRGLSQEVGSCASTI